MNRVGCDQVDLPPATCAAKARDPLWVLLSDNAEIDLPRFETGARYSCEPAPTDPAELPAHVIASPQGGGLGRLQHAGRPANADNATLGWHARRATITFHLADAYNIEAVELLLMAAATPDVIHVTCRASHASQWKSSGTLLKPTGTGRFWQLIPFETPQRATQVRIVMESGQARLLLREARVWGRLEEADPAEMPVLTAANGNDDAPLTLIGAGQAQAVIVVSAKPAYKATAAARLLQDMLFRMTGAMLPVVERLTRTDIPRLLVGPMAAAEEGVTIPQSYPDNEHFILRRLGRNVVIAGNDASPDPNGDPNSATAYSQTPGHGLAPLGFHGTLTAVCAFLELHGARFYRWDDVANYLITPRQSYIRIAALDRTERPAFLRRNISARVGTYTPARDLWRIWNRIGGVHMVYAHNPLLSPADYATHPEYVALVDGQRVDPAANEKWQLCVSNPDVVRLASDRAAEQFRASPSLRSYSLSARDNVSFCECPNCTAQAGNASDRWVAFANAVRADFASRHAEFADRTFVFYAYWGLSAPPEHVQLAPGVQAMFVGDGCHAHTWESPHEACGNHAMLAKLAGWKAASPAEPVLIYDWYIPATGTGVRSLQWQTFPWYIYTKPFVDFLYWQRQGAPVVNVEIDSEFDKLPLHWLPYYILSRASWDPSLPADDMLHDLCVSLYGDASETMGRVFKLMDRSLAEAEVHASTWRLPDPRAIYSQTRRREIEQQLERATQQTVNDTKAHARVIEVVNRWSDGWRALENLKLPERTTEMYNPDVGE